MWFGTLAVTARGSFNRHWKITFQNELFDLDNRFVIDLTRTIDRDTDFILTVIHCYPLEIVRGVIASKFHRHGTFGFTTRDTVDKIITGTSRWLVTENICTHGTCSRRFARCKPAAGSREYPMGIQLDGRTTVESAVDVGRVEPRRGIELRFARTGITKGR